MLVYDGFSLEGCLVSEKHDGVCGIWDGSTLRTRSGNVIVAPDWFLNSLPTCEIRGEIWFGRGNFEIAKAACQATDPTGKWSGVKFMVFDAPGGFDLGPHCELVQRWACVCPDQLEKEMSAIVNAGGEGVVVRDRSGIDFKKKPHSDSDAVVIDQIPGKGSRHNVTGSVLVRDRAGAEFRLPLRSEMSRQSPPAVGSVVTFTFQGLTKHGKPRHAEFLAVRAEPSLEMCN